MLTPALFIQKKRDGLELSKEEISNFIEGIVKGEVADYQASAFLMSVFFQGMSADETSYLTEAMLKSGDRYNFSHIKGPKVDKHSTGGVGDKVSLILAPLAAACGMKVPMMAGRGLGHSGGTLDKLETIPGFSVQISKDKLESNLKNVGVAIIGQTEKIAPADKKLYALRDVTATVDCIPLITGSILSKKLAEGSEYLVLDVKVGSGAFMKTKDEARKLAKSLIRVSNKLGVKCRALLTNMDQPLGYATGNALEVIESVEVLRNTSTRSNDLRELTIHLCAHMLEACGLVKNIKDGRKLSQDRLLDGSAYKIFLQMVEAQGGDTAYIEDLEKLAKAPKTVDWKAKKRGFLNKIDTEAIGHILIALGAGRTKASDPIDPGVGMIFHKKLGSKVNVGEPIVTVHAPEKLPLGGTLKDLEARFHEIIEIQSTRKTAPKMVLETILK